MNQTIANAYPWAQMLDDFRRLGGTAENVEQRIGKYGNGIFPVNPLLPVRIHVPDRLLIDVEHVVLDGDDLGVTPGSGVSDEVREFFVQYQRYFSWGADGKKSAEALEDGLKALPVGLLERLEKLRLLNLSVRHQGEWSDVVKRSFLQSRRINYQGRKVIMPIIELINHGPRGNGYQVGAGITVAGRFNGEVTVNYQPLIDPLQRFFSWGFASEEPLAFSVPMSFEVKSGQLLVVGAKTTANEMVGKLVLPKVEKREGRHFLSHVRIGEAGSPRVPRAVVRRALADWPVELVDEAFDRIRSANLAILADLLELTLESEVPLCRTLRQAIMYQLKAMSHCFGVRSELVASVR